MKICYIADGISLHTQRWVNYFASQGHEVHVISNRFPANCKGYDKNIELHNLMTVFPKLGTVARYLSFVPWIFQVRRLIREINPDILDAHYITVYGYLGAFSGFHPLVLTAWGSDILITPKKNPIHKLITRRVLRRTDLVVCRTPMMGEEIARMGVNSSKIRLCFLGVNTDEFTPKWGKEEFRRDLNISKSTPVVISTRGLKPIYDVETLIKAVPPVLKEVPGTKFIIAGDGEQKEYLKNLAQSLGVSDSIMFVGQVPHNKMPQYLASSDVYVSTSLSDGVPNSLLEAMACGLACIVTDIPANRTWIENGKNGFLVPLSDAEALAVRIGQLLPDDRSRFEFGEINVKITKERAEHRVQAQRLEEMYSELI